MTLRNSLFAVSGKASFMDARRDMSGLFVCDKTTMMPIAGILDRSQDNLVTGNSGSMSVTVHPFNAVLNRYGALLIQNDGDVKVPLAAAPSANSRIDVVFVKQQETRSPMSDDSDSPVFGVAKGVAAATPVAPNVPAGALALAQVLLPAGVSNTAGLGVVITQTYIGAAMKGDMLRVQTSAQRDALTGVPDGTLLHNVADNRDYVRNDGKWESSNTQQEMIVFSHTKVIRPSSSTVNPVLYTESELQTLAREHGITGDLGNPCVSVMNGDWNTTSIWILGVMSQNKSVLLNLSSALNANTPMRVNSLIGFAR